MRSERCSAITFGGQVCRVCNTCSHFGGELERGHIFENPGKNFDPITGCEDYLKVEYNKYADPKLRGNKWKLIALPIKKKMKPSPMNF